MPNQETYLTGVQAGLSEIDQMKIALELMLKQGGIATTSQTYEAVEERLGQNVYLSKQGKDTLRRVINTSAVKAAYILPYDKSNPGWQLTKVGEDFVTNALGYSVGRIRVTARTLVNFQLALKDVRGLLDLYQKAGVATKQRQGLEFFKRSSLLLTITAWETFLEDTFRICVMEKLRKAKSPVEVQAAFNVVAGDWYTSISQNQNKSPKPPDFVKWTGDGWKKIIENRLLDDLNDLNTPKSENIEMLSRRYLGVDVTAQWGWGNVSSSQARTKLNKLIQTRGELAHKIGNYFESKSRLRFQECKDAVAFVENLAEQTEVILERLA